jgi:hypothetical protein
MTSTMETRFLHAARGGGGAGGEELFASLTGFDCELSEAFKKEDRDRVFEVCFTSSNEMFLILNPRILNP